MSNDLEYYRRRERQEREKAAVSDDQGARKIHLEMAKRYSTMLADAGFVAMPPAQQN
jgi:hypothetical protein